MATNMLVERLTSLIFLLLLSFMGDISEVGESEFKVVNVKFMWLVCINVCW